MPRLRLFRRAKRPERVSSLGCTTTLRSKRLSSVTDAQTSNKRLATQTTQKRSVEEQRQSEDALLQYIQGSNLSIFDRCVLYSRHSGDCFARIQEMVRKQGSGSSLRAAFFDGTPLCTQIDANMKATSFSSLCVTLWSNIRGSFRTLSCRTSSSIVHVRTAMLNN